MTKPGTGFSWQGREADFWQPLEQKAVRCGLCPHRCKLEEGYAGICRVRVNRVGRLVLPWFGALSAISIDPIEKKPLYHFLPGARIYSVGFVGCNLRCPFCQNWEISQRTDISLEWIEPKDLISKSLKSGCPAIAYTYSEPCVHAEYLLEAMQCAKTKGLRNVLVTNGCINSEPAEKLLSLADAVNVDLKSWSESSYSKILHGDRDAVLSFIRKASTTCHLEVTTLIVPGVSDSLEDMAQLSGFLSSLSQNIPLHLSAYHPAWNFSKPSTELSLLENLAVEAEKRLRHVYLGNVRGRSSDTICPDCGALLIRREGYSISRGKLLKEGESIARCGSCGRNLPITLSP